MVASNRKHRPTMPKDWCPFCPGEGKKVPEHFTVYAYDNDFPALTTSPDVPYADSTGFYTSAENYGKCEVILYSPEHTAKFYELSIDHIDELLALISERCDALAADERIKYVYPFENKGEAVGVTMPHPHGCTNDWRIVRLISSSSRMTAMMCLRTAGRSPWYSRRQFCDLAAGLSRRAPAPARIRGRALSGKGRLLLRWLSCLPTGSKERELYRAFPTL